MSLIKAYPRHRCVWQLFLVHFGILIWPTLVIDFRGGDTSFSRFCPLYICVVAERWECGNPNGISKDCGKRSLLSISPSFPPFQLAFFFCLFTVRRNRYDSVPVSKMCARSVIRSSRALHSRAFGITCVHSENGKLVVRITAAFSARSVQQPS